MCLRSFECSVPAVCVGGVLSVSKQWRSLVDVNHLVPVKGYDYDCIIITIIIIIISDFFQILGKTEAIIF